MYRYNLPPSWCWSGARDSSRKGQNNWYSTSYPGAQTVGSHSRPPPSSGACIAEWSEGTRSRIWRCPKSGPAVSWHSFLGRRPCLCLKQTIHFFLKKKTNKQTNRQTESCFINKTRKKQGKGRHYKKYEDVTRESHVWRRLCGTKRGGVMNTTCLWLHIREHSIGESIYIILPDFYVTSVWHAR